MEDKNPNASTSEILDLLGRLEEVVQMNRKRNNPTWCCDQIEEKIKDYKLSLTEIKEEEVKRQMEIVIDDLESILYGQIERGGINGMEMSCLW